MSGVPVNAHVLGPRFWKTIGIILTMFLLLLIGSSIAGWVLPQGPELLYEQNAEICLHEIRFVIHAYIGSSTCSHWKKTSLSLPVWSPDGKRIAFVSYGDAYTPEDISIGDQQWNNIRVIFRSPYKGYYSSVSELDWSPDGRMLAFMVIDYSGEKSVYIINAITSRVERIYFGSLPSWSPDSTSITFLEDTRNAVVVNVATGDRHALVFGRGTLSSVIWSPDGRYILYETFQLQSAGIIRTSMSSDQMAQTTASSAQRIPTCFPHGRRMDPRSPS